MKKRVLVLFLLVHQKSILLFSKTKPILGEAYIVVYIPVIIQCAKKSSFIPVCLPSQAEPESEYKQDSGLKHTGVTEKRKYAV